MKEIIEALLKEVNGVDTTESPRISYLFSSWSKNKEFKPAYTFCFESGQTVREMLAKYGDVVVIIGKMLEVVDTTRWRAKLQVGINNAESNKAEGIIESITTHLKTATQKLYNNPERITFMSNHVQTCALAQLKVLSLHNLK